MVVARTCWCGLAVLSVFLVTMELSCHSAGAHARLDPDNTYDQQRPSLLHSQPSLLATNTGTMVSMTPYMPFLRPLAPPRANTVQRFLQFSTRARSCEQLLPRTSPSNEELYMPQTMQVAGKEDPNLTASRSADAVYPPSSMRSMPRPKHPHASRRASLPPIQRPYPTRGATHKAKIAEPLIPGPIKSLEPALCSPNLPYYVNRSRSNELPIYNERKREGGSQLRTVVKKIDGNVETLRNELCVSLGLPTGDVVINPVTRHIQIKGHHKKAIQHYLWERRF